MVKTKPAILSTRPLGKQLVNEAGANDIIIDEIDFIKTVSTHLAAATIQKYSQQDITAIFTSMNAVNAVSAYFEEPPQWKIYCIGNTTKKLAAELFRINAIKGVAANAEQLADVIIRDHVTHAVFFLRR